MVDDKWTETQVRRLKELGLDPDCIRGGQPQAESLTPQERNKLFQKIEKEQVKKQREKMVGLLTQTKKTKLQLLRERLEQTLYKLGFTGVTTPTIITKQALEKMTIDEDHLLTKQVFWLNDKQCLRPMLAPSLYSLMVDFGRLNPILKQGPIRFFEIGSCFRKESSGAHHTNEFTMLNLVEMGVPEKDRQERMDFLAHEIMKASKIEDYHFESEDSKVYGSTLDILAGPEKVEVASGAMGPHPLDDAWGITDTWIGMGFGLERLLMTSMAETTIGKWSKNLAYIDGICLRI